MTKTTTKRLYVGNLFSEVVPDDLKTRFAKFGEVENVEIKTKKDIDGKVLSTFAFVDLKINEENDLAECIRTYSNTIWKGKNIRLQLAKESFLTRLQKEREERQKTVQIDPNYDPLALIKSKKEDVNKIKSPEEEKTKKTAFFEARLHKGGSYKKMLMEEEEVDFQDRIPDGKPEPGGIINFLDNDDSVNHKRNPKSIKIDYHSSSEDDDDEEGGPKKGLVPLFPSLKRKNEIIRTNSKPHEKQIEPKKQPLQKPKPSTRQRYYSTSSDEDEEPRNKDIKKKKKPPPPPSRKESEFLSKLEKFDGGFWGSEDQNRGLKRDENPEGPKLLPTEVIEQSNMKRLNSIKQRQQEIKKLKQKIKSSLSTIDVQNKKFKFDNDEDEKEEKDESKSKKLFDEDDDDEDDNNEDAFKIRPQFEGKSGEKLLQLQSKFASDDRFKLDERFLDSRKKKKEEEEKMETEKKNKRKSSIFTDLSKLRFDPDKEEEFILREDEKVSSSSDDDEEEEVSTTSKPPSVSSERFFEVDKNLKDIFNANRQKQPSSQGFSLLSKFGKVQEEEPEKTKPYSAKTLEKPLKEDFLTSNPFKYDSSDDEDDDDDDDNEGEESDKRKSSSLAEEYHQMTDIENFSQLLKNKTGGESVEPFFFTANDERFNEALEFLNPKESLDEIRNRFEGERPLLAAIMKRKLRKKVKRQEKISFGTKKKLPNKKKRGKNWNMKK